MAKKPNLAGVLDGLADVSDRSPPQSSARRTVNRQSAERTVLVGANLDPSYARNLAMLHAETGRSKKELLSEALDMLFVAKAGPSLKRSTAEKAV